MNRKALTRLRDRLLDMPGGVKFNQNSAILSIEPCRIGGKRTRLEACTAGVAVIELCYGGDTRRVRRDLRREVFGPNAKVAGNEVLRRAAVELGAPPLDLFSTKSKGTTAAQAAAAVQRILDGKPTAWPRPRKIKNQTEGD